MASPQRNQIKNEPICILPTHFYQKTVDSFSAKILKDFLENFGGSAHHLVKSARANIELTLHLLA